MRTPKLMTAPPVAPDVPRAGRLRVVVLVAAWHADITEALYAACQQTLLNSGIKKNHILRFDVPGSFELPCAAAQVIRSLKPDGVVCLGCIVRGETRHHEYIAHSLAFAIQQLNLQGRCPVLFGVLTTDTLEQAVARSGGDQGNKGEEAARALLHMLRLRHELKRTSR